MLEKYLPRTEFESYEDFIANYTVNYPDNFNFGFDIVDGWADAEPDKRALLWCDDHGEEKTFTFTDMKKLSNQAANFFAAKGIKKGSVVMLILRRRWEFWVCAVALCKLGAIVIPGSLQLSKKDLVYRANAANIEMFVCVNDAYVMEQMEHALPEAPTVKNICLLDEDKEGWINFSKEFVNYPDTFERPTGDQTSNCKDLFLIYFTSGTTGMPKMVAHNHLYPLGHIVTAKYWQRVEENKLHMSVSDSGWGKFAWGKIFGQWICGATVFAYDMDKFYGKNLLEKIEQYKLTTFCAPPTMYRFMLQEKVEDYDLSSVHHWSTAGEALNPEVFNRWEELTGKKIASGFGQTEGTVLIANFEWFESKPGTLGKPSPIYDLHLINSDGNECEAGEEGEIVIKNIIDNPPVGLFVGYYKDAEMTAEAINENGYNLKDVCWKDNEGYLWFVGRHDDVIKCSGYRIGPFEVESALVAHDAVVECAITAAPDPIRGQVVKARVVLAKGYEPSDELTKELQKFVKDNTAPYKYPRIIEYVDELPKTLGGKIKRKELRELDEKMYGNK